MSDTYTLIFVNNSQNTWDFCCFQQDPNLDAPNALSLAWFVDRAAPTTSVTFQWEIDYDFVWSQTGVLSPGIMFTASQTWPADIQTSNQVDFTDQNGAFTFLNQTASNTPGTFSIVQDGTIPANTASVGIGMHGSGIYAVQAQPNITATFTPTPTYYVVFGQSIQQGQVLEQETTGAAQVVFPINVLSMTAILNPDNTWTVLPTSEVNQNFLAAKQHNPKALWGAAA